ncbi:hypothetical protein Tco_0942254, partial [Tanacetum coccineum]
IGSLNINTVSPIVTTAPLEATHPENSTQDINTAGPSINTASTNVNIGSLNINTVSPIVTTAPLEATHADFFMKELKDIVRIKTKRELVRIKIDDGNALWNEIGVNAGDSVNAARHTLTTANIQALVDGKKVIVTEMSVRRALQLKDVEGIEQHKEIYVTPSHTKKVFDNMKRGGKSFSGRSITNEAVNEEHVPIHSNDPLLSGEDRLKLKELLELCTKLSKRVLDLENTKTSQATEITKLKERVKKLERRNRSITPGLKRLRKVGRTARIQSSEDEGLGAQEDASKQGRKIDDLDADAEEVEVEKIKAAKPKANTTAATTTTTVVTRPKARGVVVQEPSEFTTTTSQPSQLPHAKDKGKAKMIEPEKPLKKKDQILIDEEIAQKLQAQLNAELEEEEKLAKQREEDANIAE